MRSGSLVIVCAALSIGLAWAEVQHEPHAFNFTYTDQLTVIRGVVRGTWYGNSHSAILIEPVEDSTDAPLGKVPGEDNSENLETSVPVSPLPQAAETLEAPADALAVDTGVPEDGIPPEEDLVLWELETYPVFTLERSGWQQDILMEGDAIVAVIRQSEESELHAQLLGLSRLADGWVGMGHPFPDGYSLDAVISASENETNPDRDPDVQSDLPSGVDVDLGLQGEFR